MNIERTRITTIRMSSRDVIAALKAQFPDHMEIRALPHDGVGVTLDAKSGVVTLTSSRKTED